MSFKLDKNIKARAKSTAEAIGIPLSTVLTMFLKDFTATGRIEFTASEQTTPQMERIIEQFRLDIKNGDLSPAFTTSKAAEKYLRAL
jgi:antitoxin component of RelBE/YafQ-DinJ toxin-antitoxin module